MSLKVEDYVDLDTHGMFICTVTEARVLTKTETMTYTFYQNYVKPKPQTEGKKGYVCKVCGWVYEGDPLPGIISMIESVCCLIALWSSGLLCSIFNVNL